MNGSCPAPPTFDRSAPLILVSFQFPKGIKKLSYVRDHNSCVFFLKYSRFFTCFIFHSVRDPAGSIGAPLRRGARSIVLSAAREGISALRTDRKAQTSARGIPLRLAQLFPKACLQITAVPTL